jgi:undecaprenyl-diphosphatase
MSSTVVYGVLLVVFLPTIPKRWQPAALAVTVVLVLAIGASRVGLGVHYPTDVAAGHLLGVALVVGSTARFSARLRIVGDHRY